MISNKTSLPLYEGLDDNGTPYMREPRIIGELPPPLALSLLAALAKYLGVDHISYGIPIYQSLGMTLKEAKDDDRAWLIQSGADIPLTLAIDILSL